MQHVTSTIPWTALEAQHYAGLALDYVEEQYGDAIPSPAMLATLAQERPDAVMRYLFACGARAQATYPMQPAAINATISAAMVEMFAPGRTSA